jgi:hypothetical protein
MSSIITPLSPAEEVIEEQTASREGWLHRILVALDQFGNVFLFRGQPGETISTHAARACRLGKTWGRAMSAFLDIFQADHGSKARAGDIERAKNLLRIEDAWDQPTA